MSSLYYDQSLLSVDFDFRQRVAACIAEGALGPPGEHPTTTADRILWQVSAAPGFAEAYAYAIATGVENPGRDPSVITDAQILTATTEALTPPAEAPEGAAG